MRRRLTGTASLPDGWRIERRWATVSETAIARVVSTGGERAVAKLASSLGAQLALAREAATLRRLRAELGPDGPTWLLPRVLDAGPDHLLLQQLPGRPGRSLSPGFGPASLRFLHEHRAQIVRVGPEQLDAWVARPAAQVRALCRDRSPNRRFDARLEADLDVRPASGIGAGVGTGIAAGIAAGIDRLADRLRAELAGREVRTGWAHGDLHPGNLLIDDDGDLAGVLDWDQARADDLPEIDAAFWLLTCGRHRRPLGLRIARRLRAERVWTEPEQRLLTQVAGGSALPPRAVLLLAWLRHVEANLSKSPHFARSPWWRATTVAPVLEASRPWPAPREPAR